MIDARFVYLPRPEKLPMMQARFQSSYSATLDLLERELRHLGARAITIQAGFHASRIRQDGWPYGKATPEHPACAVQFTNQKGETLVFRASRYRRFEDNLRAIAMSLEALRAVDRYGVVEGQQYTGFRQIAAGDETTGPETTIDKVRRLVQNAATEGERQAAQAALDRLERRQA